jgi:hypothetical protein
MALAYTAGWTRYLPRTAGESWGQSWKQAEGVALEGISANWVMRWAPGSQFEFAAIAGGFHNIGKSAEVR